MTKIILDLACNVVDYALQAIFYLVKIMTRLGMPYMGSKNTIAAEIINILPSAEHFYDLFCGGCAVTHAAILSGKYRVYHVNDIDPRLPRLFAAAINGKFENERRWIGREDFYNLKKLDGYVATVWSFGNNCKDYLYGKSIEPWKKALHYARVLNDTSLLREMGIKGNGSCNDVKCHLGEYQQKYAKYIGSVGVSAHSPKSFWSPENFIRLESSERLDGLKQISSLQPHEIIPTAVDYERVKIKGDSLIYCDIPYADTEGYCSGSFDYNRFFDWAYRQKNIYISSENIVDKRFKCVWEKSKRRTLHGGGNKMAVERLFISNK